MTKREYIPIRHSSRTKSLVGEKYGKLSVEECLGRHNNKTFYLCRCECGGTTEVAHGHLSGGNTSSCGCSHWDHKTKHGMASSPEYIAWQAMKARCTNPNGEAFRWYGASGITIDPTWLNDFSAFFQHMGMKPSPAHSLERIDNAKGYGPGNCRWATDLEQCNNRRNSNFITFKGRTQTLAQWADEVGISYKTLRARLDRGWPPDEALSIPALPVGTKHRSL